MALIHTLYSAILWLIAMIQAHYASIRKFGALIPVIRELIQRFEAAIQGSNAAFEPPMAPIEASTETSEEFNVLFRWFRVTFDAFTDREAARR